MIVVFEIMGEFRFMELGGEHIEDSGITGFVSIPLRDKSCYAVINKEKVIGFFKTPEEVADALFMGQMTEVTVNEVVKQRLENSDRLARALPAKKLRGTPGPL